MGVAYKEIIEFTATEEMPFPPQTWEYEEDAQGLNKIDPKLIISYYPNGRVYSRYEDEVWRLTYSQNEKQWGFVDFSRIANDEDRWLAKRLMFVVLYFSRGKGGTIKSPSSLERFYIVAVFPIYRFASEQGITLRALFENRWMMKHYIVSDVKVNPSRAIYNHTLLIFLKGLDESISGVHYDFDTKHKELLLKYDRECKNGRKQTECIPPRILQNAQKMRWEHADATLEVLPKLITFIERLMSEPANYHGGYWQAKKKAQKACVEQYCTFAELIIELGLKAFCEQYSITSSLELARYLARLTRTSRHLIYGYTGMRNDEGNNLLVGCYRPKGAGVHPVIIGIEKKNGTPVEHPFVTMTKIKKVIDLNEAITKTIAKFTHPNEEYLPLLINPQWLIGGSEKTLKYLEAESKGNELLLDEAHLIITKEEMELTLMATEPERDWNNEKDFQVGKPWKFKYHQYRRSIAVYALNTGLVSLTALGKQFRHLFEATTAHYGNGHFVAQPLAETDSKYHIKHEMDNQREHYQGLAMFRDMMFHLERPKSEFASEQEDTESLEPEGQILSPETLSTVAMKIKNKEMSYTNTAIGSCKSLKPCDGHIMLFFVGCVDCPDAETNDDKLAHTIHETRDFKEKLEVYMPGSVELRDTETDLMALIKLQQQRQGENVE